MDLACRREGGSVELEESHLVGRVEGAGVVLGLEGSRRGELRNAPFVGLLGVSLLGLGLLDGCPGFLGEGVGVEA